MSREIFDICIVGSGPAGLSAAVNAHVRRKKILLFSGESGLSKVNLSPRVDNYLGFPAINGNDLYQKFKEHVEEFKIPLVPQKVQTIGPMDSLFMLQARDTVYESKAVIIATGVAAQKLIRGEDAFVGRGISYCATCDGPLYQGKVVTVLDYTGEGAEESHFLADFCSKVYYVNMTKKSPAFKKTNIEVITGDPPEEITGGDTVSTLKTKSRTVDTDGVFIFRETYPPGELVPGMEIEGGSVKVNRKMETNIRGLYAAGDCAGKPYQVAKSVGEGQTAALNAVAYIDALELADT
ncbi:MAG: thioredoxin reductase [Peptococcaceae bacterium BICA1-7]|nr:MAG: thioredoxin reductase [Peptococcaceae bacterium BICA1-7]HBV98184.1 thioredoxin reductase [Desulfotomaculum sp.]